MNIFVIMPFKGEYDRLYRAIIERACRDRKLPVERADEILEAGNISQQVLERIRDAFFIIAEVSEDNPNVFYELGYAHASNKPIIAVANRERKLPFDITLDRTIFYDKTKPGWETDFRNELGDMIDRYFDISNRLQVEGIKTGAELPGHYHEISGRILGLEGGEHLWMFVRKDGFSLWSAQNDGEIEVNRDGRWRASLYLGWAHEADALNNWFDVLFGTINTTNNRELTERCIRNRIDSDYPPLRQLPQSLREVSWLRVKRTS